MAVLLFPLIAHSHWGACLPMGYMWSNMPFKIQGAPKAIRGALIGDNQMDMDMQNAHPGVVIDAFPGRTPLFQNYVERRSEWLEEVRRLHPQTSLSQRKDLFRAAINRHEPVNMYGAWCFELGQAPQHGSPLARKLRKMGEQLEELRKWAAENWPRWDADAEPWTNFSNLMSTLTHDAVMIMIKVLEKHGWEVVAVVADGVHVVRQSGRWPNVSAVVEEVREITGWTHFNLGIKPFTVHVGLHQQPPDDSDVDARPCCGWCSERDAASASAGGAGEMVDAPRWRDSAWVARGCARPGCAGPAVPGQRRCRQCGEALLPAQEAVEVEEDGVEPIFIGVSTVLLAEMWEVWQRGAAGEGVLSSFSAFVTATKAELHRLSRRAEPSNMAVISATGEVAVHRLLENWVCRTFNLSVRRFTTIPALMGGTTMLRWATTFDAVDGGWADRMAQLPGGNPVRKEAWDETDWRSTRSFVALDIDVAHAMKAVLFIREAMMSDRQDGRPAWHGVVLALLVAEDFAANETKAALVTKPGMAQTTVLMKIPPHRLPLRPVGGGYSRRGAPYSRTAGACCGRHVWLVAWAHEASLQRGAWRVGPEGAAQLRQVLAMTMRGGGGGVALRTARHCMADMDPLLISPVAFREMWGCSIYRPARMLGCMPHLWDGDDEPVGLGAAPQAWTPATNVKSADTEALAEAIRGAGEADPLLVDATGLVLEAHRDLVKALGVTGRGEQTRWLIEVQAALLAQLEARSRRAREHALVWARHRGVQVEWSLE